MPLPAGALRLELEAGLNYPARSLPANGTHLSFSPLAGFDGSSAPGDPREWIAGVRGFHLSHSGLFGQNGGYDGLLFRVGRRGTFCPAAAPHPSAAQPRPSSVPPSVIRP